MIFMNFFSRNSGKVGFGNDNRKTLRIILTSNTLTFGQNEAPELKKKKIKERRVTRFVIKSNNLKLEQPTQIPHHDDRVKPKR